MHILVTGGAGFIGSHVCDALLARNDQVTVLDNFDPFYAPETKWANMEKAESHHGFALVEGDIRDAQLVNNLFGRGSYDAVIHLAALAGVRESLSDPYSFNDVNINGTIRVLEACVKYGKPRFVLASTSSVYGLSSAIPYREDDPLHSPVSPYGASKIAAEKYAAIFHHVHSLPVVSLRLFTAHGERQRPDMMVHKFVRLILDGAKLPVYGDGSSSRDYTYVGDVVQGILVAVDSTIPFGVFNIGNSERHSLQEVIREIESATGQIAIIEELPEQSGDPPHTCADISAAKKHLGYSPTVSLAEGVKRFVEWLKQQ